MQGGTQNQTKSRFASVTLLDIVLVVREIHIPDMVYQRAPAVVRKRADEVVALVKPSLCAAAKTEEAKKLRDSGSEACTAFVACVTAVWLFFEPAIAALIYDIASFVRDRRLKASGIESHAIAVIEMISDIVQACAINASSCISSYGGYPKLAVDYAERAVKWVSEKSERLDNAETDADGKVVYKNAKEAVTAPRASISAAMKSTEGQRFSKAAYAVLLAVIACAAALMGALVPVLAGGVAWAVAAYWERRRAATGLDSFVFGAVQTFWSFIEKMASSSVQIAESYQGPGSLTLLQLATALKMFVDWLKEAGQKGITDERSMPSSSFDKKVVEKADEIVEKAECVVSKLEAVVHEVEKVENVVSNTEADAVGVDKVETVVSKTEIVVDEIQKSNDGSSEEDDSGVVADAQATVSENSE